MANLVTFAKKLWKDKVGGNTPITAAELNRMEGGINDCATQINKLGNSVSRVYAMEVNDLDNPPTALILNTSPDPKGFPSKLGGNSCIVIQQNFGDKTYSAQLAFGFGSDKIAIRNKRNGSNWTDWKYVTLS